MPAVYGRRDTPDGEFLTHFNTRFPQATSWQPRTLASGTSASLTGALSNKCVSLAYLVLNDSPPPPPPGNSGRPFVPAWASAPTAQPPRTPPFLFYNSSPSDIEQVVSPPDANLFELARWKKPYEQWVRRTPAWGPLTLA